MSAGVPGRDSHLSLAQKRSLCRELATREKTNAQLAREYGVSRSAVGQFARRNATEIKAIADRLDDEFAGMWIARKEQRIAAHQAEYERLLEAKSSDHHEWAKARTAILHAVAEELGQLPPRATTVVMPVTHVIVGVDTDALK